jgi:hypothetical protein
MFWLEDRAGLPGLRVRCLISRFSNSESILASLLSSCPVELGLNHFTLDLTIAMIGNLVGSIQ